jgi:hypothetical protein
MSEKSSYSATSITSRTFIRPAIPLNVLRDAMYWLAPAGLRSQETPTLISSVLRNGCKIVHAELHTEPAVYQESFEALCALASLIALTLQGEVPRVVEPLRVLVQEVSRSA